MVDFKSLDILIANFLKKALSYYIKKRIKLPPSEDEIWQSRFRDENYFIHNLTNDIRIILYKDSILSRLIYFGFENREITFLKRFLQGGDTFFDIGANIGLYSLFSSKILGEMGKVYAFEPTPETFERFKNNIELNNYNNILPFNFGLSNQKKSANFNISTDGHDAWNSLAELNQLKNRNTIKINLDTLDSFIEQQKILRIDLIKLDVEGWEKYVLEGGEELLKRNDAPVLIIEFSEDNAFAAGYYCGEIFDYIISFGYCLYSYDDETNVLSKEIKKLHYPYENLIAVKDINSCYQRLNRVS